jgi:hypothetical protein
LISGSDPVSAAILSLLPFVIAAMILIGIVSFSTLSRRRV